MSQVLGISSPAPLRKCPRHADPKRTRFDPPSRVFSAGHRPGLQQQLGAFQLPRPHGSSERGITRAPRRRVPLLQRHSELQEQRKGFCLASGRGFVHRREGWDGGAVPPPASASPVCRPLVERGRKRSSIPPRGSASSFAGRVSHGNHRLGGGGSFSVALKGKTRQERGNNVMYSSSCCIKNEPATINCSRRKAKRPGMSGETFMRRGVQLKRKKPRQGA